MSLKTPEELRPQALLPVKRKPGTNLFKGNVRRGIRGGRGEEKKESERWEQYRKDTDEMEGCLKWRSADNCVCCGVNEWIG